MWSSGKRWGVVSVLDTLEALGFRYLPARNAFFAALIAACGVNGLAVPELDHLQQSDIQISWILYLGFGLALRALILAPSTPLRRSDVVVGVVILPLLLWPLAEPAWAAVTLVALYLLTTEPREGPFTPGAMIALALTITPLWGRVFPLFLAGPLESVDLWAVSLVTGNMVDGNRMAYVHDSGSVIVGWSCTSFANASLALLLWVALTRSVRPIPKRGEWINLLAVFATVFAINTLRLALTAQSRAMHDIAHGPIGAFWVNVLLLLTTVGWCAYGLRRELVL